MNLYHASVAEFINKFEASKDQQLWLNLINEEADEVIEAASNLLKEYCDLVYVCAGMDVVTGKDAPFTQLPPFMQHKMKFVLRILEAFTQAFDDDTLDEAFTRVHASNMSKLGEDGKPIRRSDGKIQKGPNYKPADLLDLVY